MTLFLTACSQGDSSERAKKAASDLGKLSASTRLPEYPNRCRVKIDPQIQDDDDVRVIGRKLDAALAQQWGRVDACAVWYDTLREGLASTD